MVGLTIITFMVSHAVPADPIVANLGQQASQRPEIVAAFRAKWGLDRPLYVQYLTFLEGLVRGDLGVSINTRRAVTKDLAQFLPATIELSTAAIVFAVAMGLPLGVFSALYRDSPIDQSRQADLAGRRVDPHLLAGHSVPRLLRRARSGPGTRQVGGPDRRAAVGHRIVCRRQPPCREWHGIEQRPRAPHLAGAGLVQFHHGPELPRPRSAAGGGSSAGCCASR